MVFWTANSLYGGYIGNTTPLGCREHISQVFVCLEGEVVPVPHGVVSAVEKMKLQFILHTQYAAECQHLLHFLQRVVLEVADQLTLCVSVSE